MAFNFEIDSAVFEKTSERRSKMAHIHLLFANLIRATQNNLKRRANIRLVSDFLVNP